LAKKHPRKYIIQGGYGVKLFKKHMERVERVKTYAGKNKVFSIAVVAIVVFLIVNAVGGGNDELPPEVVPGTGEEVTNNGEVGEQEAVAESVDKSIEPWRFYYIDVIILVVVGGFCVVMILRERRRTRDDL
jgi:hypothetical protein